MTIHEPTTPYEFQVSLQQNRLYPVRVQADETLAHGQLAVVQTEDGVEVGKLTRIPKLAQFAWASKPPLSTATLLRMVTDADRDSLAEKKVLELQAFQACKTLVQRQKLPMQLVTAHYTFDRAKITFYYTAPQRVDFRELLKELTQTFRRTRINLRHIGARDETALLGGIGPCGKELCCSTWLRDFKPVNITMAKDQNMPLNPQKITGNCGRLMCCLNYEYEMYLEAAQRLPILGSGVRTPGGKGRVTALQFLKETMTVLLESGESQPFTLAEVELLPEDEPVNVTWVTPGLEKGNRDAG